MEERKELDLLRQCRRYREKQGFRIRYVCRASVADAGIDFDIIKNPDYECFLQTLSEYSGLAFHPSTPETCCRLVLEAKMMGLNVITNSLIGASYEPWYKHNGIDLINSMRGKKDDLLTLIRDVRQKNNSNS